MGILIRKLWSMLSVFHLTDFLNDDLYSFIQYYLYFGRRLKLDHPVGFNEKVQWLKLHYRNELIPICADKVAVREYVARKIGEQYLNKCLGVYRTAEEVDFDALPTRFVLKGAHGSGWNIICPDKSKLDYAWARKKMRRWLASDFSRVGREWQYKVMPHRIICEEYLSENDGIPLKDFKLFTFHGETKYISVEFDRSIDSSYVASLSAGHDELHHTTGLVHYNNYYDAKWNFQMDKKGAVENLASEMLERPSCLDEVISLARKVTADFPMCRADFYVVDGKKIVFGELTFTPGKGCMTLRPQSFDEELGGYIELPVKGA